MTEQTNASEYRAKAIQDGLVVAEVTAPSNEAAVREIMHYALQYASDGVVRVVLPDGNEIEVG